MFYIYCSNDPVYGTSYYKLNQKNNTKFYEKLSELYCDLKSTDSENKNVIILAHGTQNDLIADEVYACYRNPCSSSFESIVSKLIFLNVKSVIFIGCFNNIDFIKDKKEIRIIRHKKFLDFSDINDLTDAYYNCLNKNKDIDCIKEVLSDKMNLNDLDYN